MPQPSTLPAPFGAPTYVPALTGVRAVAAYLVFLHHFNPFSHSAALAPVAALVMEFHVGVPIFFVLSGFLIALRYGNSDLTAPRQWGRYIRNRFARIYPVYFLLTLLTYAVSWQQGTFYLCDLLRSLTLTHALFDTTKFIGIDQAWSLTVEVCFYLLAPAAFGLLRARPASLWFQPLVLLGLGYALVLLCAAWYTALGGFFGSGRFMLLFTLPGRSLEFYAGIQLAQVYQRGQLRAWRWRGTFTTVGLLLMLICTGGMAYIKGGYTYGQEHPLGLVLNNVALPGGILLFFAGLLTENTWVRRLLSTALLQVLGRSSYAFYLLHMGVVHTWLTSHVTTSLISVFLLLTSLSVACYYGLEEPLHRWLRPSPTPPPDFL